MVDIENANAKSKTEKYSEVLQLSSGPSQDGAECSEIQRIPKIPMQTSTKEDWSCRIKRSVASARRGRGEKRDSF